MTATSLDLAAVKTDSTNYQEAFRILIGVYSKDEVDALIGSAGSSTWGSIGGTLSNQTDLQNALNAKANSSHTHSTAEVTGLDAALSGKQATLVSGTNIKTINGVSVLGSGDIIVSGGIGGSTGATDNRVLRSDGTGGGTAQASNVTIDDSGNVTGVGALTTSGVINAGGDIFVGGSTGPRIQKANVYVYFRNNPNTAWAPIAADLIADINGWIPGGNGDLRGYRTAAKTVTFDDYTGGAITFNVIGSVNASTLLSCGTYTVATLPSASSNTGKMAQVTDSSVTTFRSTVSGGGSNRAMVFSDGTNWVVS